MFWRHVYDSSKHEESTGLCFKMEADDVLMRSVQSWSRWFTMVYLKPAVLVDGLNGFKSVSDLATCGHPIKSCSSCNVAGRWQKGIFIISCRDAFPGGCKTISEGRSTGAGPCLKVFEYVNMLFTAIFFSLSCVNWVSPVSGACHFAHTQHLD